jgi:hypothetical protein
MERKIDENKDVIYLFKRDLIETGYDEAYVYNNIIYARQTMNGNTLYSRHYLNSNTFIASNNKKYSLEGNYTNISDFERAKRNGQKIDLNV